MPCCALCCRLLGLVAGDELLWVPCGFGEGVVMIGREAL